MIRQPFIAGGILLAIMLTACTTAKPVAEWRDPDYAGGTFDQILIVGVSEQVTIRRAFENTFVDRLKERNVDATASFAVMPGDSRPSEENIRALIADIRFDAVLITHLIGVEEEQVYSPPSYHMAPYYGGMYGYYNRIGAYAYEPGYYTRHERFRLETNLYDTRTEALVWSIQSETVDPGSEQQLIDAKIKTVVERLSAQKLI